jgi:hypothetical protein
MSSRELSDDSCKEQALAFLSWQRKTGGSFHLWAHSKDLYPGDRRKILLYVGELTIGGDDALPVV